MSHIHPVNELYKNSVIIPLWTISNAESFFCRCILFPGYHGYLVDFSSVL